MEYVVAAAKVGEVPRALLNIRRQGFDGYQPVFYDRRSLQRRPLFGRYILVGIDKGQNASPLSSTRGVHYVVCNNGRWSYVPMTKIVELRKMENINGVIDLPDHELFAAYPRKAVPVVDKEFEPGQQVKITTGAFAGSVGVFQGQTVDQRERVLLSWLGTVDVAMSALEAV